VTAQPGLPGPSDAELVTRVLAADREAFAVVYDRYGDRLYDFAYSMLRHREDAADAVADSFVLFAERLGQLRDPDRLRPWLYAIVRSECLRRLKARKRVAYGDDEQLVEMADDALTPDEIAQRTALQQLVWDASAGLADRDRAILDLHLRQGLEGAELGEAMGVSASNAYVMLNRLRAQVDRSLGALLIARVGRDDCDDLDALLADWDGGFSPLVRKRVARHVDQCDLCSERRKKIVSPWMLLAGVPMFAAPLSLRDRVLNDTQLVARHGPGDGMSGPTAGTGGHRWGGPRVATVAAALLVLALLGTVLFWPDPDAAAPVADAEPTTSSSVAPATTAPPLSAVPTTSSPAEETPSPTETPSATETPSQVAGTLTVSSRLIDLGRTATRGTFTVANTGDLPLVYTVSSRSRWLQVSPIGGKLGGGSDTRVTVGVDREDVPEGRSTGSVVLSWDGGSATVRVTLVEERGPVVGRPNASAAPSCNQPTVRVTATVTDESALDTVRLRWSGPNGPGSAAMSRSGALWSAPMGPFDLGGDITFWVVARDARGNTTTGPTATITATPCPQ
jgi:RNA polymerase sigma factor (sigma-70 family)